MSEVIGNLRIASDAVYDDGQLILTLGISHFTLA